MSQSQGGSPTEPKDGQTGRRLKLAAKLVGVATLVALLADLVQISGFSAKDLWTSFASPSPSASSGNLDVRSPSAPPSPEASMGTSTTPVTVGQPKPSATTGTPKVPGPSAKTIACQKLTAAASSDAAATQNLHNSVQANVDTGEIIGHDAERFPALYDSAINAATAVGQAIAEYKNAGGVLAEELDFEHRTDLMLSTDLPALYDGVINGTNPSAYEAWNEQTRYADFARITSRTDCSA